MSLLRKYAARLAVAFLLIAVVSCGKDKLIPPTRPPVGHEIVFFGSTAADTTYHLFVINADGTGLHQLTNTVHMDWSPRWSPDGRKIVFTRRFGSQNDSDNVVVMNSNGTDLVRLTHDLSDLGPSWSPDGLQLTYQTGDFILDIWSMNADGSNQHLLMARDSTNDAAEVGWTRQGTLLGDDFSGIDLQLSPGATRLTRVLEMSVMTEAGARMSPDGSAIVFAWWGTHAAERSLYTVKPDGSNVTQLTPGPNDKTPVWSPDGARIAFIRGSQLWIMNADGSAQHQVPTGILNRLFLGDWK